MHACYAPRLAMRDAFTPETIRAEKVKPIARNTWHRTLPDGSTVIRYHATDIVTLRPDGSVRLDAAGWRTKSTKERMNDNLSTTPYRVVSGRGRWIVRRLGDAPAAVDYVDGIELPWAFDKPRPAHERDLKKAINRFVGLLTLDNMKQGAGDCFLCKFDIAKLQRGERLAPGDDREHILSHLDEGYVHGSLVVAAMLWAGYQPKGIGLWFHMAERDGRVSPTIRRAVRRYLKFRLHVA